MNADWRPDLTRTSGPKYLRLARAIARDVATGVLEPGRQLPPQRELAAALGVTQGTVSRAYREIQAQGLAEGQVGRGTFIVGEREAAGRGGVVGDLADLALNRPLDHPIRAFVRREMAELARDPASEDLLLYRPAPTAAQRRAGATWMARSGLEVDPEEVTVTGGGQHGLHLALTALAGPGDRVLTERWTYPGLMRIARAAGFELVPVPVDRDGPEPAAVAAAVEEGGLAAACFTPALHNPTTVTWSDARYGEIAGILGSAELPVVEDQVYRPLLPSAPPPLLARGVRGALVTSLSKSLTAGLRVGYLWASPDLRPVVEAGIPTTVIMISPLCAELAARLVTSPELDDFLAGHRARIASRQRILRERLGDRLGERLDGRPETPFESDPRALHAWIQLPPDRGAASVVGDARARGVLVTPGEAFAVRPADRPAAVRVSLGGHLADDAFSDAVDGLAAALSSAHSPSAVV